MKGGLERKVSIATSFDEEMHDGCKSVADVFELIVRGYYHTVGIPGTVRKEVDIIL